MEYGDGEDIDAAGVSIKYWGSKDSVQFQIMLVSAVADPTAVLTNEAEIEHAIFGGQ